MKELSIKEKAKAYDNVRDKIAIRFGYNVAKEIFSEYEESEDDRIRKSIIHLVKKSHEQGGYALHKDESEKMLAWLEKQGEQKPVELHNGDDYGIDGLWHAQRILEKTLGNVEGYQSDDGILEHKCAISAVNELSKQKPAWSEEDEKQLNDIIELLPGLSNRHNWLKSLKDRVQPKQECSKEDEDAIAQAILALESMYDPDYPERHYAGYTLTFDKAAERLKSLRPQNRWKPSEEQIKDLESVINDLDRIHNTVSYMDNHTKKNLTKILEQLKKLMEE